MELQIRKKCMEVADFPSQAIIDEFTQEPIPMDSLNLRWKQPDLVKFLVILLNFPPFFYSNNKIIVCFVLSSA